MARYPAGAEPRGRAGARARPATMPAMPSVSLPSSLRGLLARRPPVCLPATLPVCLPAIVARAEADAPVALVWGLLSDPARWPDFDPMLAAAEGPPAAPGTTWRLQGAGVPGRAVPWLRRIAVEIERAEAEHELVLRARPFPGMHEVIAVRLLPLPRQRTDIELSAHLHGPLAPSWWPVARVAGELVAGGLARAATAEAETATAETAAAAGETAGVPGTSEPDADADAAAHR